MLTDPVGFCTDVRNGSIVLYAVVMRCQDEGSTVYSLGGAGQRHWDFDEEGIRYVLGHCEVPEWSRKHLMQWLGMEG